MSPGASHLLPQNAEPALSRRETLLPLAKERVRPVPFPWSRFFLRRGRRLLLLRRGAGSFSVAGACSFSGGGAGSFSGGVCPRTEAIAIKPKTRTSEAATLIPRMYLSSRVGGGRASASAGSESHDRNSFTDIPAFHNILAAGGSNACAFPANLTVDPPPLASSGQPKGLSSLSPLRVAIYSATASRPSSFSTRAIARVSCLRRASGVPPSVWAISAQS